MQTAEAACRDSPTANRGSELMFVGEELRSSELDDVMRKCEEISASLKSKLGAVTGYCRSAIHTSACSFAGLVHSLPKGSQLAASLQPWKMSDLKCFCVYNRASHKAL